MADAPLNVAECVRRLDGTQLLIDNLVICKRKAAVFSSEFRAELHPERTLAKCWRYAQDLVHDYYTGMGSALHSSFWCPKGREILNEVATKLSTFIEQSASSLGVFGHRHVSQGTTFADPGLAKEDCQRRLYAVGNFADALADTLAGLQEAAEELKAAYQVEMDDSETRI